MPNGQPLTNPQVSVITPSYNTAALIGACLDSVFAQTYKDFEVLVVNDGSPDTPELERVLLPYQKSIVYIKQPNKRAAGARNTAIARARGEFLAFLDSDDTWSPDHLAAQMQLFEKDPSLDLVYANALIVGDAGSRSEFMQQCPSQGVADFAALLEERCQIPISTVVARKTAIERAGLFDEAMPRCDDYDLWLRSAFHGAKIAYSQNVQANLMLGRPGSLGQSNARMVEAYWKILEKTEQTLPLDPEQRAMVRKRAAEIRARYLYEEGKWQLSERQFDKARQLIAEANRHLRTSKLSLTLFGLMVAPVATQKLVAFWTKRRSGLRGAS